MKKYYYALLTFLLGWAYGRQYDFDRHLSDRPDRENPHGTDDTHHFI